MMVGRNIARTYLYILVAVFLFIFLTIPRTSIPKNAQTYVKHALGYKEVKTNFSPDKWFYQADLDNITHAKFDFDRVRNLPPHNYHGPGHETFATFYATRDPTMEDPYFAAAQQIVYRLLWRNKSKSKTHPVTVFVAPFVNQTMREYFTAAGAIVRELALRPFEPLMAGVPARLQDMFSKFEMWKELDFSKIAYLDCDAIPLLNIDGIFESAPTQTCNVSLLPEVDKPYAADICKYGFAGTHETPDSVNAGVLVFQPETAMYRRITREMLNTTGWDTGYLEQSLLSYLFHDQGPFPPHPLGLEYNSFPNYREKGIEIKILHDKMWAHYFDLDSWAIPEWRDTWKEMKAFYESEEFMIARMKDKEIAEARLSALHSSAPTYQIDPDHVHSVETDKAPIVDALNITSIDSNRTME